MTLSKYMWFSNNCTEHLKNGLFRKSFPSWKRLLLMNNGTAEIHLKCMVIIIEYLVCIIAFRNLSHLKYIKIN